MSQACLELYLCPTIFYALLYILTYFTVIVHYILLEEFDGPTVSSLGVRSQKFSYVGGSSDGGPKILSRAPPCFRRHVKPLVTAAIAVASTGLAWCVMTRSSHA
jgi:hypothetical protein